MLRAYCSTVIKGLFREVTYKLNADFEFYITLWFYEENFGWKGYKGKMLEGEDNYIKVGANRISWYSFRSKNADPQKCSDYLVKN